MEGRYEAAHLRFALQDGFKNETVDIGSLDGEKVSLEVYTDDEDVIHIIVWDSTPREQERAPGLWNAPGDWRWEQDKDGWWWRVNDALNITDGPHTEEEMAADQEPGLPPASEVASLRRHLDRKVGRAGQ